MENKINIAELLKDCPKGMELDCTMYENVKFDGIETGESFPIRIVIGGDEHEALTEFGRWNNSDNAKCVIFPKGKTTWEGFVPPYQLKDGDIVANQNNTGTWIGIYHKYNHLKGSFSSYCYLRRDGEFCANPTEGHMCYETRLATDEEKQKLFQAIKDSGYKWNAEAKSLEKLLVEPWFKVGDRIKHIVGREEVATVVGVGELHYTLDSKVGTSSFSISLQREWELVPNKFDITTLKPFESRVLVRDSSVGIWLPEFFACLCDSHECPYMIIGGTRWKCCIPFEGNEHLMCKTDDCDEFYKTWE